MDTQEEDLESYVNRAEFNAAVDEKYEHGALTKTMRVDRRDKITGWLKGDLSPPRGSWKYRTLNKGYDVVSFPELGEMDILCLKGPEKKGHIERGRYGEWRKVIGVEEFYDILLDKHIRELNHGGYRVLLKAVEKDYIGMTRYATLKFISMCTECGDSPRHAPRRHNGPRKKVVRLRAITRDFNRRCQIDLLDMTLCPDGQYTYIGLYTDHWTKLVTLFPMTGNSVEHMAFGLASSVYPYYGPPHFLHASDGKEFADKVVQCSIDKWKGGSRTVFPRGKGPLLHMREAVERTKELLISLINSRAAHDLPEGGPLTWASWLGNIMYAINNQQTGCTGKSAYKRVFERTLVSEPDAGSSQSSAGESISRKRSNSASEDASVVVTKHTSPGPAGFAKFKRPCTFVAIENHR